MKLFVKVKNTVKQMNTDTMQELPKRDFIGNLWVKIKGEWHPARKEGEESELDEMKYTGK
jgi:hypothetical protein